MRISNLRIEDREGYAVLVADVACGFSQSQELWFKVASERKSYLTDDVYDAYLIAALYPAMYYGEPIEIDGAVTDHLYRNVVSYACSVLLDFSPSMHKVSISVKETVKEAKKNERLHVGTGFSGGVDSFCTILDHYEHETDPEYKIDTLFFFNVGQNGRIDDCNTQRRVTARFDITKQFAAAAGLDCMMLDTNLFEFYLPRWEYEANPLCRLVAIAALQRALCRYYISSAVTYGQTVDFARSRHDLAIFADSYLAPMLAPARLEIVFDGGQYTRVEKTKRIADNPLAQQFLNVCISTQVDDIGHNCSVCHKCLRTMTALELMGKREQFSHVFDFKKGKRKSFQYKCLQRVTYRQNAYAHELVDYAKAQGKSFPPYIIAFPVWLFVMVGRAYRKFIIRKPR